jgi:hypothetical protein
MYFISQGNTDLTSLFGLFLAYWAFVKIFKNDRLVPELSKFICSKKRKIQRCKQIRYKQTLPVLCEGYKFRKGMWECKEELGFPLETGDRPHRGGDIKAASIWHVGEEVREWAPPQKESHGEK